MAGGDELPHVAGVHEARGALPHPHPTPDLEV